MILEDQLQETRETLKREEEEARNRHEEVFDQVLEMQTLTIQDEEEEEEQGQGDGNRIKMIKKKIQEMKEMIIKEGEQQGQEMNEEEVDKKVDKVVKDKEKEMEEIREMKKKTEEAKQKMLSFQVMAE